MGSLAFELSAYITVSATPRGASERTLELLERAAADMVFLVADLWFEEDQARTS